MLISDVNIKHGIANKGFSGLRSLVVRFNFLTVDRNVARNPLLAIPRERYAQVAESLLLINYSRILIKMTRTLKIFFIWIIKSDF